MNNSIHILPKFKLSELNSYGKQFSKGALAKSTASKNLTQGIKASWSNNISIPQNIFR